MPYVLPEVRERLDKDILSAQNPGELGYTVAMLIDAYIFRNSRDPEKPEFWFKDVAELMGTIESIKMEVYRRVVVPYENYQLNRAGDCFRQNTRVIEPDPPDWDRGHG